MKKPLPVIISGAIVLALVILSRRAEPLEIPPIRPYDVTIYDLSLSVDTGSTSIRGSNTITAVARSKISSVRLDASSATMSVDSVTTRNGPLRFSHAANSLEIFFPRPVDSLQMINFTVYYRAVSDFDGRYDSGGVLFTRIESRFRVGTSSQPTFARTWWPCNDTPSDKAALRLRLAVPAGMVPAANGRQVSETVSDGMNISVWETRYPIATYLVFFSAADYSVVRRTYLTVIGDSVPLLFYLFREDSAAGMTDFQNTEAILSYFEDTFGPYPFTREKFAVAEVEGRLTMENQTVVAFEKDMITGDRENENTLVHEIAHQWWGNLITPSTWRHIWLNEGFATYAEALYIEHRRGPTIYQQYVNVLMDQPPGFYSTPVVGSDSAAFWESFAPSVYYKGALVLHMLRRMMGDSIFFRCLKDYIADPRLRYGNASTEDFISLCESRYGHDLGWFFNQWIYTTAGAADRPIVRYHWRQESTGDGHRMTLTVRQPDTSAAPYTLPLEVSVFSGGDHEEFTVTDSLTVQEFVFEVKSPVDSVHLDPERNLFMEISETGDDRG